MTTATKVNAADDLVGVELADGWRVTERVPRRPNSTGGNFSIAYLAEHNDGRVGFCKVLNYEMAFRSPDPARAMHGLVEAYNFERDLLDECGRANLSRVVLSVADGQFQRDDYAIPTVSYIIFEVALGDVRHALDEDAEIQLAVKLRWLHHVATGLRQLHDRNVAHQDVKPSNVMVFPTGQDGVRPGKIGDLGRACDRGRPMWHDELAIAGDHNYAPPEQLYRATPLEFAPRRLGCDLYQLGSLAAFVLAGASMNGMLTIELYPSHHWSVWAGSYAEVLPYVRDAFGRCVGRVESAIESEVISGRAARLIEDLCEPDPQARGHRVTRSRPGNQYALHRVETEFDLLARRAEVEFRER